MTLGEQINNFTNKNKREMDSAKVNMMAYKMTINFDLFLTHERRHFLKFVWNSCYSNTIVLMRGYILPYLEGANKATLSLSSVGESTIVISQLQQENKKQHPNALKICLGVV
eukprot:TRINITY_DN17816_c0_g1_i3.p1 TRINITY_DN17816_c0_g1~~TRINITY_DN17816_c0_g1_i3.p1  ORF type:complete len:112 (+),score=10.40 TRINITY_DN17816_c0_g1_i3:148-483(+)